MKISRRKRKFVMLEQGEHWETRTWHVIIATTKLGLPPCLRDTMTVSIKKK